MAVDKSRYVLDSREETERLDRQSRMKAFEFEPELQFLRVQPGQTILDAGCGSGIVSDHLSRCAPGVEVVGWDVSNERIEEARTRYGSAANISFAQKNLLEADAGTARFDTIVCRYVLRHFSPADGKKVIQNLFQALKPDGRLYCIDVEGVMGDVRPASSFLKGALRKIREAGSVDFQVARKMPSLLIEQGFQDVDWHVLVSEFKGDELAREIGNLEQAVRNAEAFAIGLLGGKDRLERFKNEYFSLLRGQPGLVFFYNRIIAVGTKPSPRPQLVR